MRARLVAVTMDEASIQERILRLGELRRLNALDDREHDRAAAISYAAAVGRGAPVDVDALEHGALQVRAGLLDADSFRQLKSTLLGDTSPSGGQHFAPPSSRPADLPNTIDRDLVGHLEALEALRRRGALDDVETSQAKARLLGNPVPSKPGPIRRRRWLLAAAVAVVAIVGVVVVAQRGGPPSCSEVAREWADRARRAVTEVDLAQVWADLDVEVTDPVHNKAAAYMVSFISTYDGLTSDSLSVEALNTQVAYACG